MYNEFFRLQENPFSIAPDPRYLFLSGRHREALAHLVYGVQASGGFVLLTGEVGTGKTTICRCLLAQLGPSTQVACIVNPRLSALELLATICDEFGIASAGGAGNKHYIDLLNAFLLEAHAAGRQAVLIIDEAQNLTPDVLEQIRLLTNLETDRRKLLQIIMLGQPELRRLLDRPELRQLAQRITARYHLEPLSRREVGSYVAHRLAIAGGRPNLLPERLAGRIYRLTGGIPRRINILCDRALLGAYVRGAERVNGRILAQAAAELTPARHRWRNWGWGFAWALLLFLVLGFSFVYMSGESQVVTAAVPATEPAPEAESAIRTPPMEPVAQTIAPDVRLPPASPAESREAAFQALLAAWGITYRAGKDEGACRIAELNGLACLYRRGSLGSLRLLDRPAILTLGVPGEPQYHALLRELTQETATFIVDGEERRLPVEELERQWFGDFTLLWRLPPFSGVVRPGERGKAVDWVNRQVAGAAGLQEPPRGRRLEGEPLARLKAFQRSRGLEPDGVVGPNTLIQLDSALGGGSPRLQGRGTF